MLKLKQVKDLDMVDGGVCVFSSYHKFWFGDVFPVGSASEDL